MGFVGRRPSAAPIEAIIDAVASGAIDTGARNDPLGLVTADDIAASIIKQRGKKSDELRPSLSFCAMGSGQIEIHARPRKASIGEIKAAERLGWKWEAGIGFVRRWTDPAPSEVVAELRVLLKPFRYELEKFIGPFGQSPSALQWARAQQDKVVASAPVPPMDLLFGFPSDEGDAERWRTSTSVPPELWRSPDLQPWEQTLLVEAPETIPGMLAELAAGTRRSGLGNDLREHVALVLERAVGYLVPGQLATEVLGSDRPPELLARSPLPFPCVAALFERPLALTVKHRRSLPDQAIHPTLGVLRAHGGGVAGVVFVAGDDGARVDGVVWILLAAGEVVALPGWSSAPQMAGLLTNLATYLSWGDFEAPAPTDRRRLDDPTRAAPTRSSGERGDDLWERPPVRVISTARRDIGDEGAPTGRTVEPHTRRGHWRHTRVGPKDDWRYEVRWIAPTIVGNADSDQRPGVYVLPEPDVDQ